MVGKPHSTGCITCIRRKVKCDEGRPTCQKCMRSSIRCQGYRDLWVSVSRGGSAGPSNNDEQSDSRTSSRESGSLGRQPSMSTMPSNLDMWPFMQEISFNFLLRNFFKPNLAHQEAPGTAWLEDAFASKSNQVARLAAGCLATAYFGHTHSGDAKVIERSERQYGLALVALQSRLSDPHACWDNDNLSAAMALYCYEFLFRPEASGWIQHAGGVTRFIEARGPARHQDYPEHGIFMWARVRILSNAIMLGKRTFLEQRDWLTLPWAKHPETLGRQRQLWELRVMIPGHLQDVKEFEQAFLVQRRTLFGPGIDRAAIVQRVQGTLETLLRWRFRWEHENGSCTEIRSVETVSNLITDISRPPAFTRLIWFDEISHAIEMVHYQTLLTMLIYLGVRLFEPFLLRKALSAIPPHERAEQVGALSVPHEDTTAVEYSTEMACMLDYVLCTVGITDESICITATLRMNTFVFSLLLGDEEKSTWVIAVLGRLAEQGGIKSLKRYIDLTPPAEDIDRFRSAEPSNVRVSRADFLPLEEYGASYAPETVGGVMMEM